jgi:lipid-A-disaccharide synthase
MDRDPGRGTRDPGEQTPATSVVALCAGEASGDLLGAGLMRALKARRPDLRFVGIGGPAMRAEGLECWFDASELAVMGLVEVLRHLPRLLRLRREFLARLVALQPVVFVGIDAPDFNLGVAKRLKAAGLTTLHYVSPSIWAWRQGRAKTIGAAVDEVLCLFPFEPALYATHGGHARFVGHPFADEMALEPDRAGARRLLGLPADGPLLVVLPGSRQGEIARLADDFLAAATRFLGRHPGWRCTCAAATPAIAAALRQRIASAGHEGIEVIEGRMREVLAASDLVLAASGTATLEVALAQRPQVVAYRIAPLTYWIVRTFSLLKTAHYSLPNRLAGRAMVPEISQDDVRPERLVAELEAWLADPARREDYLAQCRAIHADLRRDASAQAAAAVLERLPPC